MKNSIVLTLAALIAAISVVPAAHATDTIYNPIVNQNFSNNCANWVSHRISSFHIRYMRCRYLFPKWIRLQGLIWPTAPR
jgi:hypothetical protein